MRISWAQAVGLVVFASALCYFPWVHNGDIPILGGATLAVHEGSHTITIWMPQTLYILAGTLGQLIFPLLVAYLGWRSKQAFVIIFALVWYASSAWGAAHYIADASAQALPLLSDGLIHDWHYLLIEDGHPTWVSPLSHLVLYSGWIATAFALLLPIYWAMLKDPVVAVPSSQLDETLFPQGIQPQDHRSLPPEVQEILKQQP